LSTKIQAPNTTDLAQMLGAIRSFPRAWGSIDEKGAYKGLIADPRIAWVMIESNAEQQSRLWRAAGISVDPTSSFATMQAATRHIDYLHLYKLRKGVFFGSVWAAEVVLHFDELQVMIGAIAASNQPALWDKFRALQAGRGQTFTNVFEAAASV